MYQPNFNYTDRVVNTLIKLEGVKSAITVFDIKNDDKHKLIVNAKTLDIFNIGSVLELEMSLKDAGKIASGLRLDNIDDENAKIISNFRDSYEFSRSPSSDSYAEMEITTIVHFLRIMSKGIKRDVLPSIRNTEFLEASDKLESFRDKSIDYSRIEYELYELIQWYNNGVLDTPPLIRISIFIYRYIELFPLSYLNYFTLLSLVDYLMYKNGFGSRVYLSNLKFFLGNIDRLLSSFSQSRVNNNLIYFVENFIYDLYKELNVTRENLNEFIKEDLESKDKPFLDLNKRQLKILRYLQTVPLIKREDYCHMMEVSTMTAFRDLNDLVRKKLIKIEGQGRGTKYRLASM